MLTDRQIQIITGYYKYQIYLKLPTWFGQSQSTLGCAVEEIVFVIL